MSKSERKCTPVALTEEHLERVAGGLINPRNPVVVGTVAEGTIPHMDRIDKLPIYLLWIH